MPVASRAQILGQLELALAYLVAVPQLICVNPIKTVDGNRAVNCHPVVKRPGPRPAATSAPERAPSHSPPMVMPATASCEKASRNIFSNSYACCPGSSPEMVRSVM
eukprot:scaffold188360_cov37-Tisochrysis_lutea.AAC.2